MSDTQSATGSPAAVHRILVPTDLSAFSEQVLDYALELARPLGASIRIFHSAVQPDYEVPYLVSPGMRGAAAAMIAKAAEVSDHIRTELESICQRKYIFGVSIEYRMVDGRPAESIVDQAQEMHADLIVMGSRSRPGVRHLLLGSVAEKVLRTAPCPVLIVHPRGESAT
jgi:nucleotide-binding universal stress UspA family protein